MDAKKCPVPWVEGITGGNKDDDELISRDEEDDDEGFDVREGVEEEWWDKGAVDITVDDDKDESVIVIR